MIAPYTQTDLTDYIVAAMARAMFVSNYADAVEEGDYQGRRAGPGEDWMDVAPETPQPYISEAWRLLGRIEQANKTNIHSLLAQACNADNVNYTEMPANGGYVRDFGHCLAMQAMGHGVSWFDDHSKFNMSIPYVEVHP